MGMNQSKTLVASQICKLGASVAVISLLYYLLRIKNNSQIKPGFPVPPEYKWKILGLYNLGQTCYLNAILQALAACNGYTRWLERRHELNKLSASVDTSESGTFLSSGGGNVFPFLKIETSAFPVLAALHKAMKVINRDEVHANEDLMSRTIPREVLQAFKSGKSPGLSWNEEQDAHEVFNLISACSIDDSKSWEKVKYLSAMRALLCEDDEQDPEPMIERWQVEPVLDGSGKVTEQFQWCFDSKGEIVSRGAAAPDSWIRHRSTFSGTIAVQLECICCAHKGPVTSEVYSCLTLPFPRPYGGCGSHPTLHQYSVVSLLEEFLKATLVYGVDCTNCSRINGKPTKSTFCKTSCLGRLPETMVLQINRAEWASRGRNKISDYVQYEHTLDLYKCVNLIDLMVASSKMANDPIKKQAQSRQRRHLPNPIYNLRAVICHIGGVESGHFVTYRRAYSVEGKLGWYCVSDKQINEVSIDFALNQMAYMLFYEKNSLMPDIKDRLPEYAYLFSK